MTDTEEEDISQSLLYRDEELLKFAKLYNAVRNGNLNETRVILQSLPEAFNERITNKGQTALHIAVKNGHEQIVKELVNQMSDESLAMCHNDGRTALISAVVYGHWRMAECMLNKKPDLISIRHARRNYLPVVMAIDYRQIEIARRLYYLTPDKDLIPQDDLNDQNIQYNAATLLTNAIYTETLDIALRLILRCPRLALAVDNNGVSPIEALASMSESFSAEHQLGFWKKCIYNYMRIPLAPPMISETRLNFSNRKQCQSNQEECQKNRSVLSTIFRYIVSGVLNFCGITQLYEMKKIHFQCNQLLSQMCKELSESNTQLTSCPQVVIDAILLAAKNGNSVFLSKVVEVERQFLWTKDSQKRRIFMLGVLHRQEKIINLLYGLDTLMNYFACSRDTQKNNMLHMAGMMTEASAGRVNQIQGTALQMQRELQWFKEIESIVHPKDKEAKNKDGLTPQQLFTNNHKNMMEKGEKWMKDTASSCTVVGALIVTIMFAVPFAIPGGNNQTTGFPIFLQKKLFTLFIISDALSLFSSSTSVLMFLGILRSRYAEEDFLEYLPRQMIIGLLTLFCSIATMMMTFSSALLIMLHEKLRIAIPLICLTSVPVTLFVWIQFPILKDMIISTYGPGIFDKKRKSKFI